MNDKAYAGDILPADAYAALQSETDAVLIDVRTEPEWQFVGMPDLSGIGKQAQMVQWQTYPGWACPTLNLPWAVKPWAFCPASPSISCAARACAPCMPPRP